MTAAAEKTPSAVPGNGVAIDPQGEVARQFGDISFTPTTFLIDRQGRIRDRKTGSEETESYERKIRAVLDEKA